MPEILLNQNNLPLGKTQKGLVVDDVGLPPWAKGMFNWRALRETFGKVLSCLTSSISCYC